jgi:hypothetical protein
MATTMTKTVDSIENSKASKVHPEIHALLAAAHAKAQERITAEDVERTAIKEVNKALDAHAAVLAKAQYGIAAGSYIRDYSGELYQVESIRSRQLSRYGFEGAKPPDIADLDLYASCVLLNRGTGMPRKSTRSRYGQRDPELKRAEVRLESRVTVVDPAELRVKQQKTTKSEAVRKLAQLDETTIGKLLKLAEANIATSAKGKR